MSTWGRDGAASFFGADLAADAFAAVAPFFAGADATLAETLLAERALTLAKLSRAGVFAVDAPPRRVGSPLLNRYLEIKRREMI